MNRWDKLDEIIARVEKILVVVFLSTFLTSIGIHHLKVI